MPEVHRSACAVLFHRFISSPGAGEGSVVAMALNRNHSEGGGVIVNNSER